MPAVRHQEAGTTLTRYVDTGYIHSSIMGTAGKAFEIDKAAVACPPHLPGTGMLANAVKVCFDSRACAASQGSFCLSYGGFVHGFGAC